MKLTTQPTLDPPDPEPDFQFDQSPPGDFDH